jgi:YHS domain-containing protein
MVSSADAPPVVLEGYCVVSMAETRKLKKADARFGAVHRGRTYLFISEAEQAKFLADPDRYAVILSGYDPVKFAKTGQLVEGKRQFGMIYQQKIYLMSDEESLNQFAASPQFFSTTAHQAMLKTETTGTQFR